MENKNWSRRDIVKKMGFASLGVTMGKEAFGNNPVRMPYPDLFRGETAKPTKPVTAIVLGAGNRGWRAYSSYAQRFPEELKIVGVAEPIPYRRERISKAFGIPAQNQFTTWEHVFDRPKFADTVFITTPDDLHYGPAMAGLDKGYDLLLEKVIAQTWKECNDILESTMKNNAIVAVCHVLRYAPYYRALKNIVESGKIGRIISIKHTELIGHIHMSHSFVRGNWGNSKVSNPIILSKSCHDTDILRWIIDRPCLRTSSFGALSFFRKENAPEGSTPRCTDGCKVERECPYSAVKIYLDRRTWLGHLNLEDVNEKTISRELRNGPYGRCVFRCDNDVADHQITNFEFEDRVTASFSLEAHTSAGRRLTRIFGSEGDISGNERTIELSNFSSGELTTYEPGTMTESGHLGGDHGLMRDFVRAVSNQKPELLSSTIQVSMASHLMGFKAEESRIKGTVEYVNL
jgi:predicted dehydrogenase